MMRIAFCFRRFRPPIIAPASGTRAAIRFLLSRSCLVCAFYAACVLPTVHSLYAGERDLCATSSRAARREAANAIPLAKFTPDDRRLVQSIVENASLYRRLPTEVVRCDPRLFSLFMQHPQTVVNIWEIMGISKVRMKRIGQDSFQSTDGNGTHGTVRILECICDDQAQNRAVVLASGTYEGPSVTGRIHADCVVVVRSGSTRDEDGIAFVTARSDVFIYLEQKGVDLVARTLQPLLVRVADRNFEQTMDFVSSFSEAAAKNPYGVARLATRLDQVSPKVQQRIATIAFQMAKEASRSMPATSSTGVHGRENVARSPRGTQIPKRSTDR